MPSIHLLVGAFVSSFCALQSETEDIAQAEKDWRPPFWQRRYYDFNVHSELKR